MVKVMTFKVQVPFTILKEGKVFVAYSPVLDLSTSGKTFGQVRRRFTEIVKIFIEELTEAGTMDEVLSNLGWRKIDSQLTPPLSVKNDLIDVAMPAVN